MNDFSQLKNHCYRLYTGFLKKHIKAQTLLPSLEEEDSVKAFCVLCHAALEEYFEKMADRTVNDSYKKYESKIFIAKVPSIQDEVDDLNKNISQLIGTLILSSAFSIYSRNTSEALKGHKSKLETASKLLEKGTSLTITDMSNLTKKANSYTKEILQEMLVFFHTHIENNHGASLKYLLKLLIPVGLDIPENLSYLNSLQKIAEYRGAYAHTKGNLTVILSAADIAKYAIDVLQLCEIINNNVKKFHVYIE